MALPVERKNLKKNLEKNKNKKNYKNFEFFFAYNTTRQSPQKNFSPIRSSRLAGYRQHIYICMSYFII